jgi:quercetin dioxygenase-like cupin family protein
MPAQAGPFPDGGSVMPFYTRSDMDEVTVSSWNPSVFQPVAGEFMKGGFVTCPRGAHAKPHLHPNEEQFIVMLEGSQLLILGDEIREIGPGDLVHIPRGTVHGAYTLTERAVAFAMKSPVGDGRVEQDYVEAEGADAIAERLAAQAAKS